MDIYINDTPSYDTQTVKLLSDAYKVSRHMLQESVTEKYSWLRAMINQMLSWIQNAEPLMQKAREKREAFLLGKRQVEQQLRKTESEIQLQRTYIERKWGWFRNEALPIIDAAAQHLELEMKEWKRLEERNWAELTIYRAISQCEQLSKFSEELLSNVNEQIAVMRRKQLTLDSKVNDIKNLILNNEPKLSQEDQQEVKMLISLAKQAQHFDSVETYLEYAASFALRRASSQTRKQVAQIIHIYSGGGPIFLDPVDNRHGKIAGRNDAEDEEVSV